MGIRFTHTTNQSELVQNVQKHYLSLRFLKTDQGGGKTLTLIVDHADQNYMRLGSMPTGNLTMKNDAPIITPENNPAIQFPVSLRDWFAGQALANKNIDEHGGPDWANRVADQAYAIADAMLAEREKGQTK